MNVIFTLFGPSVSKLSQKHNFYHHFSIAGQYRVNLWCGASYSHTHYHCALPQVNEKRSLICVQYHLFQLTASSKSTPCSMSSITKIRASVKFHPLKTLSIWPVNFRTNSQAKWGKFSYNCSMSNIMEYKVNVSIEQIKSESSKCLLTRSLNADLL